MRILLAIICFAFLISCGSDDSGESISEIVCPTTEIAGFEIQITNETSGAALSDVMITVREGSVFEEVLEESAAGTYTGVFEREGAYTLIIELDGFQTVITNTIFVERLDDECETLETQVLSFLLSEL